jgi:alkylation response protein AidB-like acyl-CoA dehydrogenase
VAIVNRRDLDFLLYEMLDVGALLAQRRFSNLDRAVVSEMLDTAQSLAEDLYWPCAATLDATEPKFVEGAVDVLPEVGVALRAYAQAGFFAQTFDAAEGGLQLPFVVSMAINGMFSCANLSIANYSMLTIAAAHLLSKFGSEQQKACFLRPMLEGRWFGTMCLSESQAGSSLADIRASAEPVGDGTYQIRGSKMWISGGDHELSENIIHMVLARIPGGPPGIRGISLFIVPKFLVNDDGVRGVRNNIALVGLNHKMGQRGTTNCMLNFGEGGPSVGYLVGDPHDGLACMFHMMNEARINVGHGAVMSGLSGYLYSLNYSRYRLQGRPVGRKDPASPQISIIEHADVRRMLLAQKAAVEGGLALSLFCASLVDQQALVTSAQEKHDLQLLIEVLTPVAKSWPSEHCLEANKLAIQVLGGAGYMREHPVERFYRDNRLNHIHEGIFSIQGLDLLGRKVRLEGGRGLDLILTRIEGTISNAVSDPGLISYANELRAMLVHLRAATRACIDCTDSERSLANATLYLDAFGHVVVGWLWLRQARIATLAIARAEGHDHSFYTGKIAACRYFFRYVLPHAATTFALVQSLDDTCLVVRSDEFQPG